MSSDPSENNKEQVTSPIPAKKSYFSDKNHAYETPVIDVKNHAYLFMSLLKENQFEVTCA